MNKTRFAFLLTQKRLRLIIKSFVLYFYLHLLMRDGSDIFISLRRCRNENCKCDSRDNDNWRILFAREKKCIPRCERFT